MKLHVGGKEVKEGWKLLNAQDGPGVDFVGDIRDLSQFQTASCSVIYGSHILEHIGQQDMVETLRGIRRLLKADGELYISVPDLDTLCRLFLHPEMDFDGKFHVMRMMFGGQVDPWDFHYIGLNFDILANYLSAAGFTACKRVDAFGLFDDTSSFAPYGVPISLNVIAYNQ